MPHEHAWTLDAVLDAPTVQHRHCDCGRVEERYIGDWAECFETAPQHEQGAEDRTGDHSHQVASTAAIRYVLEHGHDSTFPEPAETPKALAV